MRYLLTIRGDESLAQAEGLTLNGSGEFSPASEAAMAAEYGAFMAEMTQRGVLQGGERLRPPSDATTVRVRRGEALTTDGPFAETKEQVGATLWSIARTSTRPSRSRQRFLMLDLDRSK